MSSRGKAAAIGRFPVIDLFAGAGGLAAGSALAGADVRLSVEIDHEACETLRANAGVHGGTVLEADVSNLTGKDLRKAAGLKGRDPLVIAGGPPCQPFSKAAYWTDPGLDSAYRRARQKGELAERPLPITSAAPDPRRDLLGEFGRLIVEADADGFMFENVPSILHPRNRGTFCAFRERLEEAGYRTTMIDANSAAYGVPQLRRRTILLGAKGRAPEAPVVTHLLPGQEARKGLEETVTVGKAISRFDAKRYHEPEEVVTGRWAQELSEVPPGWNYKALTAWAGYHTPVFEPETRFWNFLLKLHPDRPSWTIAANPGPWVGPFHWTGRRLRTPELAAIQSFPDGYVFAGNRRQRVRQIGNAMPPLLASAMIGALIRSLGSARK
jgi:DNA (cytosine-5)-methyltransferase 1